MSVVEAVPPPHRTASPGTEDVVPVEYLSVVEAVPPHRTASPGTEDLVPVEYPACGRGCSLLHLTGQQAQVQRLKAL